MRQRIPADHIVPVEQSDREAAAMLLEGRSWLISCSQSDWLAIDQKMIRQGRRDSNFLVQAFAYHRIGLQEGK